MGLMRRNSGGKRGMFPLVLNGVEVRTLEDLRGNFDLEGVVGYFQSGELLTWLENRFYDDEADAIKNIDADDRNLSAKICAALDVECDTDLDFTRRLREKKARLAEMTDDEKIIGNAAATALNQEDLATLIQMDYKTIYLCGENFSVPIRVAGVRYVGVLSTPKIKIRAKTQDDLDAAGIAFENVQLPWQKVALEIVNENVQAAKSTIRDADMAKEITTFMKYNVLTQASQFMLAQAGQNAYSVLNLLQ